MKSDSEPVDELAPYEVFDGNPWEAGLLKSILDDNEIESLIRDNSRMAYNVYPSVASSIKVFVAFRDLERASKIVAEFRENMASQDEGATEEEQV